ncbi:hypothetical protein PFISCL1PPCAC_100 [Pristionchus fissidentatus]|uniref:Uncharacterized protein n=1 Tax=Pristionchus fissidentatus TaxID=1538716 RepID=A0AAV5URE7_9BILA|nr:hypothetical protein PFISCL1PPCAC_100 [Pristionchus fissidentatus]
MILRSSSLSSIGLLLAVFISAACAKQKHNPHMRGNRYDLTLFIRNHNVTDATFFRLVGVDNTADFMVPAGETFEQTFEVRRRGYWTLFVEFPGDRYSKSPRKIISRDSYRKWIMEVYYFPGAVGFSEWHKLSRRKERQLRRKLRHGG